MVWREGVFHGQEISTPNPAHPYNGVQSPSGTGSIARRQNDVSAARADITDYFTWYTTERAHSSLDRMTPKQSYLDLLPKLQEAA